MLIDLDKFIASMIEAFPAFKEEGRIPCMYKEALEAQGLEYKDGEIVKTQRMVSSDVKEDGCGVSEDDRIMEKIIATIHLYYGEPLEDEAKEMIAWLEKQKYKDALTWVKRFYQELSHEHQMEAEAFFIAWLEKQGYEPNWCHHKVDLSNCSEEYRKAYYDGWNNCNMQHSQCKSEGNDVVKCLINGMKSPEESLGVSSKEYNEIVNDCLYSEQKPANKIEPKFKVGNWYQCTKDFFGKGVTFDKNTAYYCAEEGCLQDEYGCHIAIVKDLYDNFKLWSIEDAKDGDVLSNGKMIVIFKHFEEPSYRQRIVAYIGLDNSGDIQITDDTWTLGIDKAKPATKEQRDLLFQKMHEDGYTFDFEKKELKKLKFRVGDEVITENEESLTITRIDEEGYWSNDLFICDFDEECIWDLVEQKSAWSEEDEQYLLICKNALAKYQITDKWDASIISRWLETKLKSLRPQPKQEWKQENREELTEFENAMMHIGGSFFGENAGLDPNDTDTIKEQAELLLELAPKTEWSEEDERIYQSIIDDTVQENQLDSKQIDWLKSIKSRVQPKQEWSEDDEKNLRRAIYATKVVYPVTADWLESIRNRITWKPSDEQKTINDTDEDIVETVKDTSILDMVEPKFKVGDIVQYITDSTDTREIEEVDTYCNMYHTDSSPIMFEIEDEWKVVVNAEDVEQNPAEWSGDVKELYLENTLIGFQNRYAHENSGEFPSAIEIAKHFYELGLKASDTELEKLIWTLPESIGDKISHQVYLMSLYHCDGQCVVDYVGESEEDSLVRIEGETFMEAATKMREWIRKRKSLYITI